MDSRFLVIASGFSMHRSPINVIRSGGLLKEQAGEYEHGIKILIITLTLILHFPGQRVSGQPSPGRENPESKTLDGNGLLLTGKNAIVFIIGAGIAR
jgi:hypothetical protein